MKRIISALCAAALMLTATACGDGTPRASPENDYRIGMASYTHTNDTYGYTEGKNGQSAVSTTYVAAVFDKAGKIVKVKIDEVESKTAFDAGGQLAGYTGGEIISKKELGDDYGMKVASGIGKEWYQQVETLEKWLEGKDVKMLSSTAANGMKAIAGAASGANSMPRGDDIPRNSDGNVSGNVPDTTMSNGTAGGDIMDGVNSAINDMTDGVENGTGTTAGWMDEDLRAGVTIDTTYMIKAIEKAYRNAE